MDKPQFSAYPNECEYITKEGFKVDVIRIEQDVVIDIDEAESKYKIYNNKTLTIIYLYNCDTWWVSIESKSFLQNTYQFKFMNY